MKTLTLLRHAKSSWDDPVARDFDRGLNARGIAGARLIGDYMKDAGLDYDHVISSPAVRCTETLDFLCEGLGRSLHPNWDRRVYLASCVTLLDLVHEAPDGAERVLMCGHNPGLEDLILLLVPDRTGDAQRDAVEEKFPTAALAELAFDVDHWTDVKNGGGRLTRLVRPRDLNPALAPDD